MPLASPTFRADVAGWLTRPDTKGTTLLCIAIDEFGTECLTWEPETLRLEFKDMYGVEPAPVNMEKLLAMFTVLTTDLFYNSLEAFHHIVTALNDETADFESWDPIGPEDAAWAITEVGLVDPSGSLEKLRDKFSMEIRRYLGLLLEGSGVHNPPDVLSHIAVMDSAVKDVDATFADEPGMYKGFFEHSQKSREQIKAYVRHETATLVDQLTRAPLHHRDQKTWTQFLDRLRAGKWLQTTAPAAKSPVD